MKPGLSDGQRPQGEPPSSLSICPRQWSHLQSSERCMVCQSPEGRAFKGKAAGLGVSRVPTEETDTDSFRPQHRGRRSITLPGFKR
ncbi:hypothetical protein EYF80_035152 [Liparis tanakae]|uniref:Uncharacterized protein n=1 Tax=Liparis tanakae TaxID=230148 RepID=A0A4Z2GN59_9TELE|nr:hypothetical protein EYF80_035152 [Liparis tanakae]